MLCLPLRRINPRIVWLQISVDRPGVRVVSQLQALTPMNHPNPPPHTTTSPLDAELSGELAELRQRQLLRTLRTISGCQSTRMVVNGQDVLLFAGANYLDLASDPRVTKGAREAVEEFGCAAGGSRLISGNLTLHERLEAELASFLSTEAALLFSTGYMANVGIVSTLAGPKDVIVSDSLNHASTIDGYRLSGAKKRIFRHNDPEDLARTATDLAGFRRRILVVDGVYSMDGDVACLRDLVPIARAHDMIVVVDDAHSLGVLGATGRGTPEHDDVEVDVQIGNLGKALGSFGAYVGCSAVMRDYLINKARPFIFTCALPPAAVGAARSALQIVKKEPERRSQLLERAAQLRAGLQASGYDTGDSATQIVPAVVGENDRVMDLCNAALERGVYAQGIRYPSVPRGTARIRFTPMATHTTDDVDEVVKVFADLNAEL